MKLVSYTRVYKDFPPFSKHLMRDIPKLIAISTATLRFYEDFGDYTPGPRIFRKN